MIIPSVTSLRTEDFPTEERKWIGTLLFPINQFMLSVVSAVNGGITFGDNIPTLTTPLKFTYSGATDFPKKIKYSLNVAPVECRICSAYEDGAPIAANLSWYYNDGQVYVAEIIKSSSSGTSALTPGSFYQFVIRINP